MTIEEYEEEEYEDDEGGAKDLPFLYDYIRRSGDWHDAEAHYAVAHRTGRCPQCRIAELEAGLEKFGQHTGRCPGRSGRVGDVSRCTCGLTKLINQRG